MDEEERFERFTQQAKRALSFAQEEAQRFNHNYIGTEHLLLGLVRITDSPAAQVLVEFGVDAHRVREGIEFIIGRGEAVIMGEIGLTPRAKKVIELAVDEARLMRHNYIGPEHLLLGLIREGEGIAAGVLESLGVRLESARQRVLTRINGSPMTSSSEFHPTRMSVGSPVAVHFNQTEQDIVDAMVESGAASSREEAVRWLFRAGIDAQQDVLDALFETVANIRGLRAEAQRRLEQTDAAAADREPDENPQDDREDPTNGVTDPK